MLERQYGIIIRVSNLVVSGLARSEWCDPADKRDRGVSRQGDIHDRLSCANLI